jgi:OOP family OmpA-OmpF porin
MDKQQIEGINMIKKSMSHTLLFASLTVFFCGQVSAEKGLAYNPSGDVWRTGSGECWTTAHRDKENQESGCFGEPELAATDSDSDGDGVVDSQDQCPGTGAGVMVDANGCPLDSDGDGVSDAQDRCPDTAPGASVDAAGCELDGDGDGVVDSRDKCPNTPDGATVSDDGCAVKIVLQNIQFEVNSDRVSSEFDAVIGQIATSLKSRRDIKSIVVIGHTDSSGDAGYNLALSEKRASAVANALIAHGVDQAMISTKGMGETSPVSDNITSEGRAENRRVELNLN